MADAGLTHGGFYSHFDSKETLVREAVTLALDCSWNELTRIADDEGGGIEKIIRTYLQPIHRDRPEHGCAAAALISDSRAIPSRPGKRSPKSCST